MGLFGRHSKPHRGKAGGEKAPESPSAYSGMRVEVLTEEHEQLFVAKLVVSSGGLAELQLLPDSTAPEPEDDAEALHVLLRGYDGDQQKAIHLEGEAKPVSGSIWRLERLKIAGKDNDRAFFRQDISVAGELMPVGRAGAAEAKGCRVLNISAGGICFQSDETYEMGEKLLLRSRLLPNSDMALLCAVCRIVERRPGVVEYGCRFEDLDPASEDLISKTIMQLQMKKMKR